MVPGIHRRTLVSSERMMQMEVTLDGGSTLAVHTHPHEQITYVVRGRLRMLVNGEARELGPGDSLLLPGDTPHGVQVIEDSLVIDTFNPPREDLLAQDNQLL
jgi:quercetin dioxygenase-like cupin family protein